MGSQLGGSAHAAGLISFRFLWGANGRTERSERIVDFVNDDGPV